MCLEYHYPGGFRTVRNQVSRSGRSITQLNASRVTALVQTDALCGPAIKSRQVPLGRQT